jgi:hypothetical protein
MGSRWDEMALNLHKEVGLTSTPSFTDDCVYMDIMNTKPLLGVGVVPKCGGCNSNFTYCRLIEGWAENNSK